MIIIGLVFMFSMVLSYIMILIFFAYQILSSKRLLDRYFTDEFVQKNYYLKDLRRNFLIYILAFCISIPLGWYMGIDYVIIVLRAFFNGEIL